MSNPLIPLFAKEHPGETFEVGDVNEWACQEISRLHSELVDTRNLLDSAIIGGDRLLDKVVECQKRVGQLNDSVKRYQEFFSGRELPPNIDIDTAVKERDAALTKLQTLQSMFSVFSDNVREELL